MAHALTSSQRSISKDLTIGLILVVLIVSTIALFTAYGVSKRKAQAELEAKADEYIAFLKDTLILPIWNYDFETINAVCRTYIQNDLITGIDVTDKKGHIHINADKADTRTSLIRTAELFRHGIPVGKVRISLTHGYLTQFNRQLFWSFALTILINLGTLILMTGIMLRMSLKRPLNRLNRIVDAYAAGEHHSFSKDVPHAELRPLVQTLDEMGQKIRTQVSTIQKAEKKYRGIFENAIEGIYQSTPEGRILSANPAYARILGYPSPEALMSSITDIGSQHWVDPSHRRTFVELIGQKKEISGFETQLFRKDGKIIWISINARPVYNSAGTVQHFEGMAQDITHRKKTEAQLRRLYIAVEQVADIIFITDGQGLIDYVNPAFESATGYTTAELTRRNPSILGADQLDEETYRHIENVVLHGQVWTGRITNKKKDGKPFIVEATVSPIRSHSGRYLGYVAVNRDVTEKIKHENQLRQAQKMEAIGTLAGGIAHDFNNMLGVIIGCSELAMDALPETHVARADMQKVLDTGLNAKELVRQILTFSRQSESELKPLLLQPFIKEVVKFLKSTLPSTIDIRISMDENAGAVLADPIEIQQIMMNLCTNAAHAMEPVGGIIHIDLSTLDVEEGDASRFPGVKPGPYLKLTVQDTGAGIPGDIIHRIFDPFFTTKSVGEGTGLGLSVVHGIVKKHGGTVFVDSTTEKGTMFQVLLSRLEHPGIQISADAVDPVPGGNERILLVEDEVILADILQRILSGLGYQVQTFVSSVKGAAYLEENPERFDLALLDYTMPEMNGIDTAKKIMACRPTLPVILYTGTNEKLLEKEAIEAGIKRLLAKPLNRLDLAFAIRKVLDERQ